MQFKNYILADQVFTFEVGSLLSRPPVLAASPTLINSILLSFCLISGNSFPACAQTTTPGYTRHVREGRTADCRGSGRCAGIAAHSPSPAWSPEGHLTHHGQDSTAVTQGCPSWAPSVGVEVDMRGGPTAPLLSIPGHPPPGAPLARRHGGQHPGRVPQVLRRRVLLLPAEGQAEAGMGRLGTQPGWAVTTPPSVLEVDPRVRALYRSGRASPGS